MTILGSPGSGKGFYGRRFAEAWDIPLYSASKILKESNSLSVDILKSGNLLDCDLASNTILGYLERSHNFSKRFLIDGFPRTLRQVTLMDSDWPDALKIPVALHLDVPDPVCVDKIVGRKLCSVCGQEPNIADVQYGKFNLPPMRPLSCMDRCDPDAHWYRRPDDKSKDVVLQRIAEYREHEKELIESYSGPGKNVYSYSPYRGAKDFDAMKQYLEERLYAL